MKFEVIENKAKRPEHLLIYDDVTEFVQRAVAAVSDGDDPWPRSQVRVEKTDWIGRDFDTPENAIEALQQPWKEGLDLIEKIKGHIAESALPSPKSRRRRRRWDENDGDDVDIDRLRAGQDYWAQRK